MSWRHFKKHEHVFGPLEECCDVCKVSQGELIADLQQRLHDAEAERERQVEKGRYNAKLVAMYRDVLKQPGLKATAEAISQLTAAHARIAALTDAVQRIYNLKPQRFEDWNNLNGEAHLIAAAALALLPARALLSPVLADAAGGPEA